MDFDVLSVGDIVTDAFIKLLDNEAHSYTNDHGKWLAVPFAQKVPFDHVEVLEAVGNAANAAVSFSRLGLKAGFITNVGGDQYGRDMIKSLDDDDVDTRFVRVNPGKKSNYHYVLWYKEERTILIKHEEYDYHWPHLSAKEMPKWIYFSSVSKKSLEYHDDIAGWLERHPEVNFAFQPGTFQIDAGVERFGRLYSRAHILVLNREEAVEVTKGDHDDIKDLLSRLHSIGAQVVVITDGPKGAYASDSQNRFKMPPYPDPSPPFERTGAGDAFASTFTAAMMKGKTLEEALRWAPINSMSVVQQVGAQKGLLKENALEAWLKKAPADYRPRQF